MDWKNDGTEEVGIFVKEELCEIVEVRRKSDRVIEVEVLVFEVKVA